MKEIIGAELLVDLPNKRLKVFPEDTGLQPAKKDAPGVLAHSETLLTLAQQKELDKIIVFEREPFQAAWREQGYIPEGTIDGFYNGEPAFLQSRFLSSQRMAAPYRKEEDEIIRTIHQAENDSLASPLPPGLEIRNAEIQDAPDIVEIFSEVFDSYPTPMFEVAYVQKVMQENVHLAVAENENGLIGVASAEIDFARQNAEITDCATLPSYRGRGIMNHLIGFLEKQMVKRNVPHLFSLARAVSFGMNKALYNRDYVYRGRLVKNVHIAGKWEDMNIWVKPMV